MPFADSLSLFLVSMMQSHQLNGVNYGVPEGLTNLKSSSKPMDSREPNGPEARHSQTSMIFAHGSGSNLERSSMSGIQSSGSINGRSSSNLGAKHQGRCASQSFNLPTDIISLVCKRN